MTFERPSSGSPRVHPPTVTIGMPLYNEERFVGDAIRSLLSQTFVDFELLVSDNASTDRTGEICREFQVADSRVRYHRNDTNIGAAANFDRVMKLARGRYFLWAGGHDLWDPELLELSVRVLDTHPAATVAGAECVWIDGNGNRLLRRSGWTDTSGMSSIERLFAVVWGNMHPILGLIRTDALRRTAGMQSCMAADLLVLCELALQGDFTYVPGTCWYRRDIRPQETYAAMMRRHRSAEYKLSFGLAARLPLLTLGTRLLSIAWRAQLPLVTRLAVCAGLAGQMPARYLGARLRRM